MKLVSRRNIIILIVCILLVPVGVFSKKYITAYEIKSGISIGNKHLSGGKYAEAILDFKKVIKVDSKSIEARIGLANVYIKEKKFTDAETILKDALKINNKLEKIYLLLCTVYVSEDKLDDATKLLTESSKFIDLSTDISYLGEIKVSKLAYTTASTQMIAKNYLDAITNFTKVIKADVVRYKDASVKISACKKLYITDTIASGTESLKSNNLTEASKAVKIVLNLDTSNSDALKLKTDIALAIKRQKDIQDSKATKLKEAELATQPEVYTNTNYNIQLTLPSYLRGKYGVLVDKSNDSTFSNIEFCYLIDGKIPMKTDSDGNTEAATVLFSIYIRSNGHMRSNYSSGHDGLLGQSDGKIYEWATMKTLGKPLIDGTNATDATIITNMWDNDLFSIMDTFKVNGMPLVNN